MIFRGFVKITITTVLTAVLGLTAVAQSGRSWMNGRVFGESDVTGIMGATVELVGEPNSARRSVKLTTQTDANGKYALKDIPYGEYSFRVSAPGFIAYQTKLNIASDALTELHVKLKKEK